MPDNRTILSILLVGTFCTCVCAVAPDAWGGVLPPEMAGDPAVLTRKQWVPERRNTFTGTPGATGQPNRAKTETASTHGGRPWLSATYWGCRGPSPAGAPRPRGRSTSGAACGLPARKQVWISLSRLPTPAVPDLDENNSIDLSPKRAQVMKVTVIIFLLSVISCACAAILCPPNFCDSVTCEEVTSETCEGRVQDGGSMCGCCDTCITQIPLGMNCYQTMLLGVPATSECEQGTKCDFASMTCITSPHSGYVTFASSVRVDGHAWREVNLATFTSRNCKRHHDQDSCHGQKNPHKPALAVGQGEDHVRALLVVEFSSVTLKSLVDMKFVLACLAVLTLEALSAQAWHQRRPYARVNAVPPKPGVCPPIPPMAVGICASTCDGDHYCAGADKCCRNACGAFTCAPPTDVTTPSPRATPDNGPDVMPTDSQPGDESTTPTAAEEGPRRPLGRGLFPVFPGEDVPERPLPPREQRCTFQPDAGPCRGFFRRFYYNIQTRSCQLFGYGGCLGNANNFRTVEDCENACQPRPNKEVCPPCREFDSLKPLYCSKNFIVIAEVRDVSTSGDVTTANLQVKRLNVYRQGSLRLRGRSYFPQRFKAQVVLPNQESNCACATLTAGKEYVFMGDRVNSSGAGVIGDGDYVRAVNDENARELANLYRVGRSVVCRV
ncbi:receptor antagonist [Branchiostoma belcheri]|nr:receptor antagonist [Branchiostoma belcheri]